MLLEGVSLRGVEDSACHELDQEAFSELDDCMMSVKELLESSLTSSMGGSQTVSPSEQATRIPVAMIATVAVILRWARDFLLRMGTS
jgi:hypothetical protein